jgi:hypothetical protein
MRVVRSFVALALLLVPAAASAATPTDDPVERHPPSRPHAQARPHRTARVQKPEPKTCLKAAVEVVAGAESSTFSLARCDGAPAPLAVDQLSILARPGGAAKPKVTVDVLSKSKGPEVAPGIRRIDPRLVERLETVIEHFRGKAGAVSKVLLVSGYRPRSSGSYHQSGRALDFRIDGVQNEALVAFCKTLPDTGCGYYPNSLFVHMDVRDAGAGHVAWIDVSRPGEAPKYVSAWPLPAGENAPKPPSVPTDEQPIPPMSLAVPADGPGHGRRLDRRKYFF